MDILIYDNCSLILNILLCMRIELSVWSFEIKVSTFLMWKVILNILLYT